MENDAIVADYFSMLADDLSGRSYIKADHNRTLQASIGRAKGSIEYKHQNISAVLKALGEPWLEGYKPAYNFQATLVHAVTRWLNKNPQWFHIVVDTLNSTEPHLIAEEELLWIGPPPTQSNQPPPAELAQLSALAQEYDVANRNERDRILGRSGEQIVLRNEKAILRSTGRPDLAEAVRWVSDLDGDGAGYDIASYFPGGQERLIEVKTTNGWERTPFHISRNELAVANRRQDAWRLVRVWNFARSPKAFELRPPLEEHVTLTPTSFLGAFQ